MVLLGTICMSQPLRADIDHSWRATRPEPGKPSDLILPKFESNTLKNGLKIYVVSNSKLPIVQLSFINMGGAALDPKDKPGLGQITYEMLDEGAGDKDTLAFADAVSDLGANIHATGSRDHGTISISGLSKHKNALIQLLAESIRKPRFDASAFDRVKKQKLASLKRQLASLMGLASQKFPSLIYGPDHAFGRPSSGTPDSIGQITLDDVKKQYEVLLQPQRSAFIAAGDITLEEATTLAQKAWSDWKTTNKIDVNITAVEAHKRKQIIILDKPKSPQTLILMGRPVFSKGDKQEIPLEVANEAWGGLFSSRLNMNLREDKGYTYGASSSLSLYQGTGSFLAYAKVETKYTAASIKEFFKELKDLTHKPLSAEEIQRVKDGIIRGLPSRFQGIGRTAGAGSNLFIYNLPLNYYSQYIDQIQNIKMPDVQKVVSEFLKEEMMQVLLVGDAELISKDLQAAEIKDFKVEKL